MQPALSSCRNFGWTCQSFPGLFLTHGQVGVAALDYYLRLSGFLSIPHFLTNRLKMTQDCKDSLFRSDVSRSYIYVVVSFSPRQLVQLSGTPPGGTISATWHVTDLCNFLSNRCKECNTLEQCFKKHFIAMPF